MLEIVFFMLFVFKYIMTLVNLF